MFDAYQEHLDHEAGCFHSELEAAFAVSRATTPVANDSAAIREALEAGKVALVCEYPVYCRHTDAVLGYARELEAVFEPDAVPADLVLFDGEGDGSRLLLRPSDLVPAPVVLSSLSDEDIPF